MMANGWTPDRRARQRELIQRWKPWERSTGPKTAEGKARVARNAYKGSAARTRRRRCRRAARRPPPAAVQQLARPTTLNLIEFRRELGAQVPPEALDIRGKETNGLE